MEFKMSIALLRGNELRIYSEENPTIDYMMSQVAELSNSEAAGNMFFGVFDDDEIALYGSFTIDPVTKICDICTMNLPTMENLHKYPWYLELFKHIPIIQKIVIKRKITIDPELFAAPTEKTETKFTIHRGMPSFH